MSEKRDDSFEARAARIFAASPLGRQRAQEREQERKREQRRKAVIFMVAWLGPWLLMLAAWWLEGR